MRAFFSFFSFFHFSFSPFSDRFFPFTLVVFFWIYLFVLSNGIHAICVSFALSSFPISRGIDGCIRSQILSHCIRFSYLDLFFLCLLIFFFSLSSHYDALLLILFSSEFLFFFNSTDTEKNAMFAFVSFHKTGVKWPKKTNAMHKREEKKSNNNNQSINKFVFVRVAPFMRRSEKLTTKIKSETFKWNKRKTEKEANEKWTKQKKIFRSKSTRK